MKLVMKSHGAKLGILFSIPVLIGLTAGVLAQEQATYMMPPEPIARLIDAPKTPSVSLNPDHTWMLLRERPGQPSIEEVAQPELRIGGLRINPRTNGESRGHYFNGLVFRSFSDNEERRVTGLPENVRISSVTWSPDGKKIGFLITDNEGITLWTASVKNPEAKEVSSLRMNDTYSWAYRWVSDSKTVIALTIPENRGAPPPDPIAPAGPTTQENLGRKAPAHTYQDLLKNQHDENLFEYYLTSQVVKLELNGKATPLGSPAIFQVARPSPDGKYILVKNIHRPFSYTVPVGRFPKLVQVWDMDGEVVYTLDDLALADDVPVAYGSVRKGRRSSQWRADAGAELCWSEALDGGDAGAEAEHRDQVYLLAAPFTDEPVPLATLDMRYGGITWGNDDLALVESWWWKTRMYRIWHVHPGSPSIPLELSVERSWEDRYNDPGEPLTTRTERGTSVIYTADDGDLMYLVGDGASPEGDRPFIDEFRLSTKDTVRLFRSEAPYYERPITVLDPEKKTLLTWRESVEEPPNGFIRNLTDNTIRQITEFQHPTPELKDVQKELIRYKRADSLDMTATLYLPAGYDAERDGPLPVLMWAYPEEYKSADAAGQVTDSPYRFVRVGVHSPLYWLVHGYAVLDYPTMPIVGEGEDEPNDTYVEQLVSSAEAAVDEMVRRGVGERGRMAIGGHSYGAFMTGNLLAHSDLFALGIARSGAYNRTLTPFGFQAEERTYWEAPEIYYAMSPFMHADKINEPLLMIHGEMDNNSGTFPLQSERMYGALKGLGATVRLVVLPHESHGYRARESIMHMLWEMTTWLDQYVKNAELEPGTP